MRGSRSGDGAAEPLMAEEVERLIPGALESDAAVGSRIVTLHWLHRLLSARAEWDLTIAASDKTLEAESARPTATPEQSLHAARVALRRLRASLREYESTIDIGKKPRRALARLNKATNAARDSDVQRAWLIAEMESLDNDSATDARRLLNELDRRRESERKRVSKSFRKHLDPVVERLLDALEYVEQTVRIVPNRKPDSFAALLGERLASGAEAMSLMLADCVCPSDESSELRDSTVEPTSLLKELHKLRIVLKRQRALISPFSEWHPALSEWYKMATSGQDALGAMRDAAMLATEARKRDMTALARVLQTVSRAHEESFRSAWCENQEAAQSVAQLSRRATTALMSLDTSRPLPMEIERKYLLRDIPPEALAAPPLLIEQGWLPGVVLRERLRRTTGPDGKVLLTRTIKAGPLGARIELEEETDQLLFETLWSFTANARIRKKRHRIPYQGAVWEIDVFLDRDLVLAEIELQGESQKPVLPEWLTPYVIRDVTEDPRFTNSAMATSDPSPIEGVR